MGSARVNVAEGAGQRVPVIDPAAAARRRDQIDRLAAEPGGIGALGAVAGAGLGVRQRASLRNRRRLVAVAEIEAPRGRHGGAGLGDLDVDGAELGEPLARIVRGAGARGLDIALYRRFRHAEHGRADPGEEHGEEREPIDRTGVDRVARCGAVARIRRVDGAVRGDEQVLDRRVVAAGATKARGAPSVEDRVLPLRHQEQAELRRLRALHHGGEEVGAGVVDAAAEGPASAQPVAAIHPLRLAAGEDQVAGHQGVPVGVPDLVLRPAGPERELEGAACEVAIDPAGGRAAAGDQRHDLHHRSVVDLGTAEAHRQRRADQAALDEIGDGLVGNPPQLLRRGGPFAQRRDQRFRAREQSLPIERRHWLRREAIRPRPAARPSAAPAAACDRRRPS